MRSGNLIKKEVIASAMIDNLVEEKHPKEIKTPYLEKFKTPAGIRIKDGNRTYVPDITARFEHGSNLYAIELKNEFKPEKWRLFSIHAKKHNGNFYLIVPEWLKESVKEELQNQHISAGIIFFST